MDTSTRKPAPALVDIFYREPYRFDFHQAVRILEKLSPQGKKLGEGNTPVHEVVRLKARIFLSAPTSDLQAFQAHHGSWGTPELVVNFFGVAGIQGPLPTPYTERIMQRSKVKDYAGEDFLNIFNHRLISLVRRVAIKTSIGTHDAKPEETDLGKAVQAIAGLGLGVLQQHQQLPDRALLHGASLLWQRPRSGQGLAQLIEHYFRMRATYIPLQGKWKTIPVQETTRLGTKRGAFQGLGKEAYLGHRHWDHVAPVVVKIKPPTQDAYRNILPGGSAYPALRDMVRYYVSLEHDGKVIFEVANSIQSQASLGKRTPLGWIGLLGMRASSYHAHYISLSLF